MKTGLFILLLFVLAKSTQAQLPKVAQGKIVRYENFPSKYVQPRNIDVWLPPGYSPQKKYAVLYMHDGEMLFDSANTWNRQEWTVDETLGTLIKNMHVKETIVVGIWNTEDRWLEYFPEKAFNLLSKQWQDSLLSGLDLQKNAKPFSDKYLKFIVKEVKPFIDSAYSTNRDFSNTYTMGSSIGGLIAMYAVCEYPLVFGGAACMSTHWPGGLANGNPQNKITAQALNKYMMSKLPSSRNHRFYFDYGTEGLDKHYEKFQKMIDKTMQAKGYTNSGWMTLRISGADHEEKSWAQRLAGPMFFLLKK